MGMDLPFVIHAHSGYGPLHYDLMLRQAEALATWQLSSWPADLSVGDEVSARKLPDHRLTFLSYEGPISGKRGEVEMVDHGQYRLISRTPLRWEVVFHGTALTGRWTLTRPAETEDTWILVRL